MKTHYLVSTTSGDAVQKYKLCLDPVMTSAHASMFKEAGGSQKQTHCLVSSSSGYSAQKCKLCLNHAVTSAHASMFMES
jgi:hypothetical protein